VLRFLDDLSCGPIDPDEPRVRAKWWETDEDAFAAETSRFWDRVEIGPERIIVWYGAHHAGELAFVHAWCARMEHREQYVVDVTGFTFPITRPDGTLGVSRPMQTMGYMQPRDIRGFFGQERLWPDAEKHAFALNWRRLMAENAPFRRVTDQGLQSAPVDYLDPLLLEHATPEWQSINRLIGTALAYGSEPYIQTGDVMLHRRIVALVEQGRLLADRDPRQRLGCSVRRPDHA
jgi:hypothetical protein